MPLAFVPSAECPKLEYSKLHRLVLLLSLQAKPYPTSGSKTLFLQAPIATQSCQFYVK